MIVAINLYVTCVVTFLFARTPLMELKGFLVCLVLWVHVNTQNYYMVNMIVVVHSAEYFNSNNMTLYAQTKNHYSLLFTLAFLQFRFDIYIYIYIYIHYIRYIYKINNLKFYISLDNSHVQNKHQPSWWSNFNMHNCLWRYNSDDIFSTTNTMYQSKQIRDCIKTRQLKNEVTRYDSHKCFLACCMVEEEIPKGVKLK